MLVERKGLGQAERTVSFYEALQQAAPAIVTMSQQYRRAAPLVDWMIDHPKTAVSVFIGSIALAAFIGAVVGSSGTVRRLLTPGAE